MRKTLLLVMIAAVSMLSGCGSSDEAANTQKASVEKPYAAGPSAPPQSKGPLKVPTN